MSDLRTTARAYIRALDEVKRTAEAYYAAAVAVGNEAPDGATYRGLDGRQVRRALKLELVARLSPKPVIGMPAPVFELEGAPEARRFAAAHKLPGL